MQALFITYFDEIDASVQYLHSDSANRWCFELPGMLCKFTLMSLAETLDDDSFLTAPQATTRSVPSSPLAHPPSDAGYMFLGIKFKLDREFG